MQLSGNAVTHKQMTFDFSLFNGADGRQPGARIWMLAPAVQNRLKHAIGLADASVTSEADMPHMHAHAGVVDAYALGSNLKGEFFMQFGIVNQMSRGVAGSMRAIDYAKDATACTVPTNSEVLLRFTIGDPSVERECTGDEVVEFVRERTCASIDTDDNALYTELTTNADTLYHKYSKKHSHEHAKHLNHTVDLKHLKRGSGDQQFFKKYAEKYKDAAVIVSLLQVVQLGAKKAVERKKMQDAPHEAKAKIEGLQVPGTSDHLKVPVPPAISSELNTTVPTKSTQSQRRAKQSHATSEKVLTLGQESESPAHVSEEPKGGKSFSKS